MTSDYIKICEDNRKRYGTEGAQKSGNLAAMLYDDRTHFIFELLQNTEDALGRRDTREAPVNTVKFTLSPTSLMLSHFGKPFNEADVRSVCDIAESTKNESAIGRFGLGFKSVYTITDLPEIHSGEEDFVIEEYVFPKPTHRNVCEDNETQIILPFKSDDPTITEDIIQSFRKLRPDALLFLNHIDEVNWVVEGVASGFYLRNQPEVLGSNVKMISLIGQEEGKPEVDQRWLVFHRDVAVDEKQKTGKVEIAFSVTESQDSSKPWVIQPIDSSPLVVFFPTVVETRLGFLMQGPYRTTPSRDNILPNDPWNQHLIKETASLLVEALRWMRDHNVLDVPALNCLPLDRKNTPQGSPFSPIFEAVQQAFELEALLPTADGRYVVASEAKLPRTQEIRQLFEPHQIAALFGTTTTAWLSGDITSDKTPEAYSYITKTLNVELVTPEKILANLRKNPSFFGSQSDQWMSLFYGFLKGQDALLRTPNNNIKSMPFIRLENGEHVAAFENNQANAFLPSDIVTDFPTVHRAVCHTPESLDFLRSLGLTEPNPVDDVIRNILPRYKEPDADVDECELTYTLDIERILTAFNTDSSSQKQKLIEALKDTNFLIVVDAATGVRYVSKPQHAYIPTDRLKQLFAGVPKVFMVDDSYVCLKGEAIRELLITCGASRYLKPLPTVCTLSSTEKAEIRKSAGLVPSGWKERLKDFRLQGLTELLQLLQSLSIEESRTKASLLWEALLDLEKKYVNAFHGLYEWSYSHEKRAELFNAEFIRTLRQVSWIPNKDGELVPPHLVSFEDLKWEPSLFLQAKIKFKPSAIDQLAKEVGIEAGLIELLRTSGITTSAQLEPFLANLTSQIGKATPTVDLELNAPPSIDAQPTYRSPNNPSPDRSQHAYRDQHHDVSRDGSNADAERKNTSHQYQRSSSAQTGTRQFISYVGMHTGTEEEHDPEGLNQEQRMSLEARALDFIISLEPTLHRTLAGNAGFDLYENDENGVAVRWIEVKSMTKSLHHHPVAISDTQFYFAQSKRQSFWLYVVEYANDPVNTRLIRIQDPVGKAKHFTFDYGWIEAGRVIENKKTFKEDGQN